MSSKTKSKNTVQPKLRFPEFQDAGGWEAKELGKIAELITEKAGDRKFILMSITSGLGLVSQIEKFGREIAGAAYKNYFVIQKNDFAYNKSATKEYSEGYIAMYSGENEGAVPNSIFTCFRIRDNEVHAKYLNYLFSTNIHGKWLRNFLTVGARAHGSLNVNNNDLLALPVPIPQGQHSKEEQQKIAECLSSLDELIAAEDQKLDALKRHKKGLMQQLFPAEGETLPNRRFPEFKDAPEWEEKPLGKLFSIGNGRDYKNLGKGDIPVYGTGGYMLSVDDYLYDGESVCIGRKGTIDKPVFLTGKFWTVDTLFYTHSFKGSIPKFIFLIFQNIDWKKHNEAGGVPSLNKTNIERITTNAPKVSEQQRIAAFFSSVDDLITEQSKKLDALRDHKKGLMQQLFPTISNESEG